MTHSVSQRLSGDLRIHSSGIQTPKKADDTPYILFRSAVLDSLEARMQACSDDTTHDALRQIADAFQKSKDITLPEGASGTDTHGKPDKKAVNWFITGLIQARVHELDSRVSKRLHQSMSADKASAVLHLGMAQYRITPLNAAFERAENGTFLKICLGEDLSAATAQCNKAEYSLFMADLPDVIQRLSQRVDTLVAAKEDNHRERCLRFTDALKNLVMAEVEANKAKIEELSCQNRTYNDQYADNVDIREEKIAALKKACEQHCADLENLIEQLEHKAVIQSLPPDLGSNAEAFLSDQSVLAGLREQLATSKQEAHQPAKQSRTTAMLKDAQANSERLLSEKTGLTSRIAKLSQAADSRSRFGEFILRIRRIFGGGAGQKTRADYRAEIRPLKARLEQVQCLQKQTSQEIQTLKTTLAAELHALEQHKLQHAQHLTTLKTQLSDAESRFEKRREDLKLAAGSAISSIKKNLGDELSAITAAFNEHNEPLEDAYTDRAGKIRLLEEINVRLKQRLKGDLLSADNFRLLMKQLCDSPERDHLNQLLSEIERKRSTDSPQQRAIENLQSLIRECHSTRHLHQTFGLSETVREGINTLREKLESWGNGTLRFEPATTQNLIQAGHLYALQSVDKVKSHYLAEAVAKAAELTPHTLTLLSSLEKEIGLTAFTDKDILSEAAISRRNERLAKIDQQLAGIRRIVTKNPDKALSVSADFNDQRYLQDLDAYVDRQHDHGTCTMHTWNNLLAYLSNNQHLPMTPWRMEKLIQSEVVQSAHQLLSELLDASGHRVLSLKRIEHTLEKVIRSSDLVSPSKLPYFVQHGHVMNYQTKRSDVIHAENNNLHHTSLRLFELADFKGENLFSQLNMFRRDDSKEIKKSQALNALISNAHDAYSLCFAHTAPNMGAHAVALIRSGDNFALIDSNYTEPVKLSLSQLVDFISTGDSHSDEVNEKLTARHYDEYSVIYFSSGFYKEQRT